MKKLTLVIVMLALGLVAMAQENKSYQFTLEDCIRYAFANSNERKSMELNSESQKVSYEQSKREMLPNLSASLGENFSNNAKGWSTSGNIGIGSSVVIYRGGSIRNTIEQNRLSLEHAQAQLERYDNQLTTQILQAFLNIIGNDELLQYQAEVLKTSREQCKQGQVKYKVGSILESDLLLLEAQYYSDSNNMVDTRITRDNNLLTLKGLLSMQPSDELQVVVPDTEGLESLFLTLPSEDEAIAMALDYLPDLRMGAFEIQIAQKSVDLARGNYLPSITANANVGAGFLSFDAAGNKEWFSTPSESVGVSVSVPIYNRGATKASVRKSQIALEQAQLNYEQSILDIRQTVAQAYKDVVAAYNAYKVSEVKEEAYRKSLTAYNIQYQYGNITTVELLQQENNYLNTMNNFIRDKYTLVMMRKILDVYMGKSITL